MTSKVTMYTLIEEVLTSELGPEIFTAVINFKDKEDDWVTRHHSSYGRYVRNTLNLWVEGSKESEFFKTVYNVSHADDMSSILMKKIYLMFNENWVADKVKEFNDHWEMMKQLNAGKVVTIDHKGKQIQIEGGPLGAFDDSWDK